MDRAVTTIDGVEYPLDTTLRVAYQIQGANDHKPYSQVFAGMGDMHLEKQIEIIYLAFKIANPEAAKSYPWQKFLEYYLGNFTLKEVMAQLKIIIKSILGSDESDEGGEAEGN